MRDNAIALVLIALLAAAVVGGCSSSRASMPSWQKAVERYAADNGGPNVLGDATLTGDRRGFAVIGGIDPKKSTDVRGLLIGHQTIDNRPWFIYLVGNVEKQRVTDIHLAAVTFAGGKPQWVVSPKDANAVSLYRNYNEGLWKRQNAQEKPPAEFTTFPRDADSFDLSLTGTKIQVTHPPSGAIWTTDIAAKAKH